MRSDASRWQRATDLARRAGLDQMRNVWSNAMIARDAGRPWIGVDYSLLREAIRVDESRWEIPALRSRVIRPILRRLFGVSYA
jgi:hypothetical protein